MQVKCVLKMKNMNKNSDFEKQQKKMILRKSIRCSFKFLLKVGIEESIVNAPLVSLQSKKTTDLYDTLDSG
jgi:hypothetical protein